MGGVGAGDTLVAQLTGYYSATVTASAFSRNPHILMRPRENRLAEVPVFASDAFLYAAFENCRQKLLKAETRKTRAYFVLESELGQNPSELLECYYNAYFNARRIERLDFKNGRLGLAPHNGRYFVNLNSSRAVVLLDLCRENARFPDGPFQFNPRQLRKEFQLELLGVYDSTETVYRIGFSPRRRQQQAFSGEAWIKKNSGELLQLQLRIDTTTRHPFVPAFEGQGRILQAGLQIKKVYDASAPTPTLSHMYFDYQLVYAHRHSASLVHANNDTVFNTSTRGLLRFYAADRPFYIPRVANDEALSDYRKITGLAYNAGFWSCNDGLPYTDRMKQAIAYFKKNGVLVNFPSGRQVYIDNRIFENNFFLWSAAKRLSLKKDGVKNDTLRQGQTPLVMAYQLNAHLYFDLNEGVDSLQHFSCTVFDTYNSWYNLREEPFTNCFLNIYLDLFEIERRRMEAAMRAKTHTAAQLDSIYQQHAAYAEKTARAYLAEVERGKKTVALARWNAAVKDVLGLDNMALFGVGQ